jgi:hypothetical protein
MKAGRLVPIGVLTFGWYQINRFDTEKWKQLSYLKGEQISLKYSRYQAWNSIAEPFIVRQFAFLFSVGNEFIRGLVSDNREQMSESIRELEKTVDDELSEYCKKT